MNAQEEVDLLFARLRVENIREGLLLAEFANRLRIVDKPLAFLINALEFGVSTLLKNELSPHIHPLNIQTNNLCVSILDVASKSLLEDNATTQSWHDARIVLDKCAHLHRPFMGCTNKQREVDLEQLYNLRRLVLHVLDAVQFLPFAIPIPFKLHLDVGELQVLTKIPAAKARDGLVTIRGRLWARTRAWPFNLR